MVSFSADFNNNRSPFVPVERDYPASMSSSPARLQGSSRGSGTSVVGITPPQSAVPEMDTGRKESATEEEATFRHVLKSLKEATGFGSYKAYLSSFREDPMYVGRSYADILDACFLNRGDVRSGVDLIEVRSGGGPAEVNLRGENLSASEVSMILEHPGPGTTVQIVLWPIDDHDNGFEDMVDVLGLGLQLDPCFFEPLRWSEVGTNERFRSKTVLQLGSIGTSVYVARRYMLAQATSVHVVLIAGPLHTAMNKFKYKRKGFPRNKVFYGLVQGAPLYDHFNRAGEPHFANVYIRAFSNLLQGGPDTAPTPSDILSACIIPLLQIEIVICKGDLDFFSSIFNSIKDAMKDYGSAFVTKYRGDHEITIDCLSSSGRDPEFLYCYRTKLRSWIEYFENQNGALLGLLSAPFGPNIAKGPFYLQIKKESISIARESSRLEAELRDYLQLEVSTLALEESQNSIQVSNRQIDEGKRVKVFTVLAFFYVPLNLATSVFGMNLQQLNGSGTSIGAFLATAGIALFLTGVSWLLIEGTQRVRVWLRQNPGYDHPQSKEPRNHNLAVRLYMIWWLSRSGLLKWMIRTGAGWCILIKSPRGFQPGQHDLCFEGFKLARLSRTSYKTKKHTRLY